ncbi:MAG: transporter ATP-binding protein, partial [Bradyrhizobium sp.]|nr:transporter ATP-binding protein [Bradyrhizobium sp.]
MSGFATRHPAWTLLLVVLCAILLWMIFAVWPSELEQAIGR